MGLALHNPSSLHLKLNPNPNLGHGHVPGPLAGPGPQPALVPNLPDPQRRRHLRCTRVRTRKHLANYQLQRPVYRHSGAPAHSTNHNKASSWVDDAGEGLVLARSEVKLPGTWGRLGSGEVTRGSFRETRVAGRGSSNTRSRSPATTSRRPPSLERQDAFRDPRTTKKRRRNHSLGLNSPPVWFDDAAAAVGGDAEANEIAGLYRLGLLYDNEYERGEGFSLARIDRAEAAFSVRVRPSKRKSASVFCASPSSQRHSTHSEPVGSSPKGLAQNTPCLQLEIVHELEADTVAEQPLTPAVDLFESLYEITSSYCLGEEDEESETAWAIIDGCNGWNEDAARAAVQKAMVEWEEKEEAADPWVVLDHDGS